MNGQKRLWKRRIRVILRALIPTMFILLMTNYLSSHFDWNWWGVLIAVFMIVLSVDLLFLYWLFRKQKKKIKK